MKNLVFLTVFFFFYITCFVDRAAAFTFTQLYVEPDVTTVHRSCSEPPETKSRNSILTCSCSPSCHVDGDCCLDASLFKTSLDPVPVGKLQCFAVRGYSTRSFYMISSCDALWSDNEVKSFCDVKNDDGSDEIRKVPVSSLRSNATYRNLYCALCNGESNDIVPWNVELECNRKKLAKFFKQLLQQCSPQDVKPSILNLRDIAHTCYKGIIAECSSKNVTMRRMCHLCYAPVETKRGTLYKNKFCAFCNGEEYQDLQCTEVKLKPLAKGGFINVFKGTFYTKVIFGFVITTAISSKCGPDYLLVNWSREDHKDKTNEGRCVKIGNSSKKEDPFDCPGKIEISNEYTIESDRSVFLHETNVSIPLHGYHILGNSSVLICLEENSSGFQGLLFIICSSVSLVALLLKIIFHFCLPEPKTLSSMSVVALSIAMFFAQIFLLFGVDKTFNYVFCVAIACIIHYFLLASFSWTNVLAFSIFRSFSSLTYAIKSSKRIRKRFFKLNVYAWSVPLPFVILSIIFDRVTIINALKPGIGKNVCWFTNSRALLLFLGFPLALILAANVFFFMFTAIKICRTSKEIQTVRKNACGRVEIVRFRLYMKLALIMGLTWVIAFIAAYVNVEAIWIIFDVLHALQGTLIFLGFTDLGVKSKVNNLRESWMRLRSSNQTELSNLLRGSRDSEDRNKEKVIAESNDDLNNSPDCSLTKGNFSQCIDCD